MSEKEAERPGEIIRPIGHALLVSPDRTSIGLTFDSHDGRRVTILLPLSAATGLGETLGQILDTLAVGTDDTNGKSRPN